VPLKSHGRRAVVETEAVKLAASLRRVADFGSNRMSIFSEAGSPGITPLRGP